MESLKVGIIGCGAWGKNLVRVFYNLGILSKVCTTNQEHKNKILQLMPDITFNTFEEIISDSEISAVIIATPALFHFEMVKKALCAKKHVLVEKPLCLTTKELLLLQSLAEDYKRILMVGHIMQFHPTFLKLRENLNKVGKIKYIHAVRTQQLQQKRDVHCLWDVAPHDLSMILSLLKNSTPKININYTFPEQSNFPEIISLQLSFANSVSAQIFVSWQHPIKEQKLSILGDQGMLVFDDCKDWNSKLLFVDKNKNHEYLTITPQEPLKSECLHFLECIEKGKKPITDSTESLPIINILERTDQLLSKN